jgi:hypothetical protein
MHLLNPITSEQISLPSVITVEQVTPILMKTVQSVSIGTQGTQQTQLLDHLQHIL